MAMLRTQEESEPIYVSAGNANKLIRLRIGPSNRGPARIVSLRPAEARKIALFLLQSADKLSA